MRLNPTTSLRQYTYHFSSMPLYTFGRKDAIMQQ